MISLLGTLALLATSSLLFIVTPRMPLYQVTSLQIISLKISSYLKMKISAKILAGVQIENANFIGADLHATIVDIYYPDWNGEFRHIGVLKETNAADTDGEKICIEKKENEENEKKEGKNENENNIINSSTSIITNNDEEKEDDHGICLPPDNNDSTPFFTIQPRAVSISNSDAVTIIVNDISPSVYLNLIKDAIVKRGSIEIFISGVAHVKSPLGIPLSLGILCDNTVNLLQMPIQIIGRSCAVKSVSTGWLGLTELAAEVRENAMKLFKERGAIRKQRHEDNNVDDDNGKSSGSGDKRSKSEKKNDGMDPFLVSSEIILDWHDF